MDPRRIIKEPNIEKNIYYGILPFSKDRSIIFTPCKSIHSLPGYYSQELNEKKSVQSRFETAFKTYLECTEQHPNDIIIHTYHDIRPLTVHSSPYHKYHNGFTCRVTKKHKRRITNEYFIYGVNIEGTEILSEFTESINARELLETKNLRKPFRKSLENYLTNHHTVPIRRNNRASWK
jgi:hypothetical protein